MGPRVGRRFKGIYQAKAKASVHRPWCAECDNVSLGRFATQEEAARAYDAFAVVHFGAFARLNFPEEHPRG